LGAGFAGRPVTLSLLEIRAMALHTWIYMPYPPALRGPANQAAKRGREKNESLSEPAPRASRQDDPTGPFDSFRAKAQPPAGARIDGRLFCGSFFWSLRKMSHQGSSTPLPLLGADFWLDPKTGEASAATHEIKRSRPAEDRRRSRFTPLKFPNSPLQKTNLTLMKRAASGAQTRRITPPTRGASLR